MSSYTYDSEAVEHPALFSGLPPPETAAERKRRRDREARAIYRSKPDSRLKRKARALARRARLAVRVIVPDLCER
ncbi:hypothetical protein [Paracoccus sp. PAR01]|uniref:hypothetical protein n=1 Tax=Paracoccus sp. PAR01 TaxID=2769282 RepID=UPI0017805C91|nr:hypothetical protein [Paracoccus sp. PAR01]MBD9529842.1 hypothetical protein [Paracoccus sp. PAR01]